MIDLTMTPERVRRLFAREEARGFTLEEEPVVRELFREKYDQAREGYARHFEQTLEEFDRTWQLVPYKMIVIVEGDPDTLGVTWRPILRVRWREGVR